MMRFLLGVVLGLGIVGNLPAADPKLPTLRWYGQSFFQLTTSKGTRVVFDPHAIEAYGRTKVEADLVLISHRHNDHTQTEVLVNQKKFKVMNGLAERNGRLDWDFLDEKFKDVRIRVVGTYHDTMQGMERGKNAVFVLTVDGLNIVFLGDLGHILTAEQVKQIGPVDVLMIPVGGIYTLNGAEAKKVQAQLKPTKYIIPMHCGTAAFGDLLSADEFLDEQKNVKRYDSNRIDLDPNYKPETPQIVQLRRYHDIK